MIDLRKRGVYAAPARTFQYFVGRVIVTGAFSYQGYTGRKMEVLASVKDLCLWCFTRTLRGLLALASRVETSGEKKEGRKISRKAQ